MIRVCVPDDRKRIFRDRRPLRLAALDSVWLRATGSHHRFEKIRYKEIRLPICI
jgi:hypothetical protein